uniref:Fibrinogen like 2 n=1 Tax=Leptobrachium leishanense TaxID=445787 RepID=A0A8C5QHQ0_9ANUR
MKTLLFIVVSVALSAALDEETNEGTSGEKAASGCPIRMKNGGKCEEDGTCPYQLTLPPMTIQLPKQFQLLEKTIREVQSLKEMVNSIKKSCHDCKLQADDNLDKNPMSFPDGGQEDQIQELQTKMKKMSISLKNARIQITSLQGQLEMMNPISMNNVEDYVEHKIANLSCSNNCELKSNPSIQLIFQDCAAYYKIGKKLNGTYRVTPDPKNKTFEVYCDMESSGGGWTVIQIRKDGSTNFSRTWSEYKSGFGNLTAEFWLGNDKLHLLTKSSNMILRIELEDFKGSKEYAQYDQFYVANEIIRYRLTVGGYTGTAGDAMQYNKQYNHDQKFFTTPDRDNDRYPSGNCGAYYSSGWWFDACMSANLNGKYYDKDYKGIRNGIFWGTWRNATDGQLNSFRQTFKSVKMMIRPKDFSG